jgi:hypothetical protein
MSATEPRENLIDTLEPDRTAERKPEYRLQSHET